MPRARFRVGMRLAESRRFQLTGSKSRPFVRGCRREGHPWLQGRVHYSRTGRKTQEQRENILCGKQQTEIDSGVADGRIVEEWTYTNFAEAYQRAFAARAR